MPIVLVVDDSPVDQQLVGGLLKRDLDWIVEYADNGEVALEMIADTFPDVVVTDLQMPKMNGIDLCRRTRSDFPHVPVILTTGHGSEQLAVEALNAGAASYVPKSALADSLAETVTQILEFSRKNKCQKRLMDCSTNCRQQFKLANDPELIPPLLDFLQESMKAIQLGDATEIRQSAVALEEAVLNAMFHGNLELDEQQARKARAAFHEGETFDIVNLRQSIEPYHNRFVYVAIDLSKTRAQLIVRDQGDGFDIKSVVPDDADTDHMSELNRRGLTLIRSFMDEVTFNETGTEIRMTVQVNTSALA